MPIFEYSCDGCGAAFEKIVFRSDEEIACPECGGQALTREASAFACKSGERFTSSSASSSCSGCNRSGGCSGCGGH